MNIDIKALIAKITGKDKGSVPAKRKENPISKFFQKNPKMKIIVAAIAVVVSLAVAVTIILTYKNSSPDLDTNVTANENAAVDILPETERDIGETVNGEDPFDENALNAAKLTGIYDFYGYKTATLQTSSKSYTLREGDSVGKSDWIVSEITDSSIKIALGDKTKSYTLG